MIRVFKLICLLAVFVTAQGLAGAQTYRIDWNSANSGGGSATGGGMTLTSTLGQTAAGFATTTDRLHWMGFWSGGVPTPALVARVADAKTLPIGSFVSVVGKVTISTETDFYGCIYLEDESRQAGIRVALPPGVISGLVRDRSIVNVIGTTGIAANDEREIAATLIILTSTRQDPLGPLAMGNNAVGGADLGIPPLGQLGVTDGKGLNNVGILVMTPGRVLETGVGYLLLSDGSPLPVRVSTEGLTNLPGQGDYIVVTGISSLYPSGADRLRMILPRQRSDIWPP